MSDSSSLMSPIYSSLPETQNITPGLYLVSTPIGNLRDITIRALDALRQADRILCEDTRQSGKLLKTYGISVRLESYHDHSTDKSRQRILQLLKDGEKIALISDAGTPMISDPGFKLVRDAQQSEISVIPVPGANAILPAVQLCGFGCDKFTFLGFLPQKSGARTKILEDFKNSPTPLILYESASRLCATAQSCFDSLGERPATIIREITKLYEETIPGHLSDFANPTSKKGNHEKLKGEIVLVIDRPKAQIMQEADIIALLQQHMSEGHSLKQAVAEVTSLTGRRKQEIYQLALNIKKSMT